MDELERAARALVDIYESACPDWWPVEMDELREALDVIEKSRCGDKGCTDAHGDEY